MPLGRVETIQSLVRIGEIILQWMPWLIPARHDEQCENIDSRECIKIDWLF